MKHKPRKRLLFVCLGNICRSPLAEGVMQHLVNQAGREEEFYIDSAGIGGWHVGQLPDPRMREMAKRYGYNLTSRARQFRSDDFNHFDGIYVMDEENYEDVLSRAPQGADIAKVQYLSQYLPKELARKEIPDPYYGGADGFRLVVELVEAACQNLLNNWSE